VARRRGATPSYTSEAICSMAAGRAVSMIRVSMGLRFQRAGAVAREEGRLDALGLLLEAVPLDQRLVEVLVLRAHAPDVEGELGAHLVAAGLEVVAHGQGHGRHDLEALGGVVEGPAEGAAPVVRAPEVGEETVGDLGGHGQGRGLQRGSACPRRSGARCGGCGRGRWRRRRGRAPGRPRPGSRPSRRRGPGGGWRCTRGWPSPGCGTARRASPRPPGARRRPGRG
jgi:hypothetical protein